MGAAGPAFRPARITAWQPEFVVVCARFCPDSGLRAARAAVQQQRQQQRQQRSSGSSGGAASCRDSVCSSQWWPPLVASGVLQGWSTGAHLTAAANGVSDSGSGGAAARSLREQRRGRPLEQSGAGAELVPCWVAVDGGPVGDSSGSSGGSGTDNDHCLLSAGLPRLGARPAVASAAEHVGGRGSCGSGCWVVVCVVAWAVRARRRCRTVVGRMRSPLFSRSWHWWCCGTG